MNNRELVTFTVSDKFLSSTIEAYARLTEQINYTDNLSFINIEQVSPTSYEITCFLNKESLN